MMVQMLGQVFLFKVLDPLAGGKTSDIDDCVNLVKGKDFYEFFDCPIAGPNSVNDHIDIITEL